jgi:tetratricopeptide (TPR) repeat protein
MIGRFSLVAFFCAAVSAGPTASAQMRIPEKFTNLQVLPKDIGRDDLVTTMRNINGALGVRCDHCHVSADSGLVFAADDKPTKKMAREMFRLVSDINGELASLGVNPDARSRVRCVTCHHGLAKPRTLSAELMTAYDAKGVDSAKALYRSLRSRYYGRAAYDFSEGSLSTVADEIAAKPERRRDAIAVWELNLEYAPQSMTSYLALARLHTIGGDTTQAIAVLTKATEHDPQNRQVQQMLSALRGGARRPSP